MGVVLGYAHMFPNWDDSCGFRKNRYGPRVEYSPHRKLPATLKQANSGKWGQPAGVHGGMSTGLVGLAFGYGRTRRILLSTLD